MDRYRIVIIAAAAGATFAALVGLSAVYEMTYVPAMHYQIGWAVTILGCGFMAWKLRANALVTLLACTAFLIGVRYAAFVVAYALLESGVLWQL